MELDPIEAWLWLIGSLVIAILWTNLAWLFRQPRFDSTSKFISRATTYRFSPWLFQFLRLLYYVGVPYTALLLGQDAVVGRFLGLGGERVADSATIWLDWANDVGWAVALGVGTWLLLALGWWTYRRALAIAAGGDAGAEASVSGWVLLREAAYHEVHWTFYRNAPILIMGTYWGGWAGLALVALEAALNPAWRKGFADPQQALAQLIRGALATVSSVLFLKTENLWMALILHWGVTWGLVKLVRAFSLPRAHNLDSAFA
jgi:hypothetical protein